MEIPEITITTWNADGSLRNSKGGRIILEAWEVPDKPKMGFPNPESKITFEESEAFLMNYLLKDGQE